MYIQGKSKKEVLDYLSQLDDENFISISLPTIWRFTKQADKTIERLIITGYYPELIKAFNIHALRIRNFLFYLNSKFDGHNKDPCDFSYDFYLKGGGYKKNSAFLWGIPYQFLTLRN